MCKHTNLTGELIMRKSFFIIKVVFILSLLLPCFVFADDWNAGTGGNPSRNSLSTERGPLTPTLIWEGGLPAVVALPPVIEDNILAMSRIHNINDVLHGTLIVAHDLTTGETLWTADLPVDFPSTDWRNRVSAIRDGRVYATRSGDNNYSFMYALDAMTGAIIWRSQDSVSENSTESPSFAENGDLIVGSLLNVERINAANGTRVWRSNRISPTSNGNEAVVSGNKLYLWEASGQGPKVKAFDLTTGAVLYSSPAISGGLVQQIGLFAGPDGTVYAPRSQGNETTDYLVSLKDNDSSLTENWRVPLGYVPFASFGIGPDGSVYSYSRSHRVVRINPQTGAIEDSSEILVSDFYQPRMAIDSTGIIYVTNGGFSQGALYSFDPDLTTRWSVEITNVNIGGPAIGQNGTMVVCGTGTDVRAYQGTPVGIEEDGLSPLARIPELFQNFPNPFNSECVIGYTIPSACRVTVDVYDILGRKVTSLIDQDQQAGLYQVTWKGQEAASGTYLYKIQAGEFTETKIMMLLK